MTLIPLKRSQNPRPLCVDLDGTLIKSDSLVEAAWVYLRSHPFAFWYLLLWLFEGRSQLKNKLFSAVKLNVASLPYNEEILSYLKEEKIQGRRLILVTASSILLAQDVANYLQIFDEVYGSEEAINLKGKRKAERLNQLYGRKGYDYIGNSYHDLPVWEDAKENLVVSNSKRLVRRVRSITDDFKVFRSTTHGFVKALALQIRVHQWAKNMLIFLPMILSHRYHEWSIWLASIVAFVAFSLSSSAVYVVNDMLDLEADRHHPHNRRRPFAAGELSLILGIVLVPFLLTLSLTLALIVSMPFFWVLISYLLITTLYSTWLKQLVLADIIILALLYSWRVLAGSMATGIELSEWFLTFAIFFFCSLALLKRSSELILLKSRSETSNPRRGYLTDDLPLLVSFGVGSGYLSVLVLALYLNDPLVVAQKQFPLILWLMCPLLLYWISRMWLKAYRGQMPTDPLVFALRDNVSYSLLIIISVLWLLSRGLF